MEELTRAYLRWRDASSERSERGELRPDAAERAALEIYLAAVEAAPHGLRLEWDVVRPSIDAALPAPCACGHPTSHHDGSGSCFHVIGCATACDCGGVSGTAV